MPTSSFFKKPQNAAILKHGILGRYLQPFAQKLGSTHDYIAYLDGFSGPGRYDDGTKGSPAVALDVARKVAATRSRTTMYGIFVEEDPHHVGSLKAFLAQEDVTWPVYEGAVEDHLPAIISSLPARTALFAFFDPFGLGVPLNDLQTQVFSRSEPTEVLLNFSFPGLRRTAGHLTSSKDYSAKKSFVERLNRSMGGTWWQPIWTSGDKDREEQILKGYFRRLSDLGWSLWQVPVADRWLGPESYVLLHLTKHQDGHWEFAQSLSAALEEYRAACFANAGQLDLEPPEDREKRWIDEIYASLEASLAAGKSLKVQQDLKEVCGPAFAFARAKHIRAAVKRLYKDNKTSTTGVGDVQTMVINPPMP